MPHLFPSRPLNTAPTCLTNSPCGSRSTRWWVGLLLVVAPTSMVLAQTTTFRYVNDTQNYTVPTGVTHIQVVATGAAGGRSDASTPYSSGARVTAILSVTPGEVLLVDVGGQGVSGGYVNAGGLNGGGQGSGTAGGGGGATNLRRAAAIYTTDDYLRSRNAILVAGGGGGSDGGGARGGVGGTPVGGDGISNNVGIKGAGATQTAAGGIGSLAGLNNQGGKGNLGGGGGGGYYGGGGGAPTMGSSGGGGGSSWVTSEGSSAISFTQGSEASGNGSLTLTPIVTPLPVRPGAVASAGLSLFPNPATAAATLTGAVAGTPVHVLDPLGRVVFTTLTDAKGSASLPLPAALPRGLYLVRAGQQAVRLIVK